MEPCRDDLKRAMVNLFYRCDKDYGTRIAAKLGLKDVQFEPEIKLFWNMASPPARAVRSLLLAGGVKHESIHLDIFRGEHKQPRYMALNPAGTLPFITVNGKPMNESAAILRYLARKFKSLNHLYPENLVTAQVIDAGLDFCGTSLRPMLLDQIRPTLGPQDDAAKARIAKGVAQEEGILSKWEKRQQEGGNLYVAGNAPSIADYQLFCEMKVFDYLEKPYGAYPNLVRWHDAVRVLKGIKEVHDEWEKSVLPVVIGMTKAAKGG